MNLLEIGASRLELTALGSFNYDNLSAYLKMTMKIGSLALKNFKAFKNVEMNNIPSFCV
jgi:hypothetical protein